ncbi:MAG: hypothetical protein KA956_08390 [Pyrinomonadaceae bacterium]|nr:hypothetical protein [Acidobacteriota bacterium]MBK7934666.1 hypothetical protein [Acidobacteriota bacterium]MBP7376484.1 hypothetical protein [Pyrinomonadaceae bacterium]
MKNFSLKSFAALSLLTIVTVFGAANAAAAQAPNLEVMTWQGNATPLVESPYTYTTRVKNVGNRTANNVTLTVEFPLTNTSPNRHILGKLTGVQTPQGTCSVVSNKIVCNFGNMNNNQIRQVSFTFEFQVATTAPTLKSTATTTSTNEANAANNTRSFTPAVRYPDNVISSGNYLVTSCSGTNLTSFYECELYPSSQQSFDMDLNLGGTISIQQAPTYTGLWDQNGLPANKTLHFTIDGGMGTEVIFNGFATSGSCFEGIATFPQSPNYNAAYRVCEQ